MARMAPKTRATGLESEPAPPLMGIDDEAVAVGTEPDRVFAALEDVCDDEDILVIVESVVTMAVLVRLVTMPVAVVAAVPAADEAPVAVSMAVDATIAVPAADEATPVPPV